MKTKITCKQLKEHFKNVIEVGYCDLQYLLYYKDPLYYNSGVYGWNFDCYIVNSTTCIITGYRNLNGTIRAKYETCQKYERQAKEIIYNNNYLDDYEIKKEELDSLLDNLVNEIIKE